MLRLVLPLEEGFDESTNKFVVVSGATIELEHSLRSVSKWESRFEKPFLSGGEKTDEEVLWYVKAMIISPDVPGNLFELLKEEHVEQIQNYIASKQTATWFSDGEGKPSREIITSELIYYWMIANNIPFECQDWHLNRLLTLIKVCVKKNQPEKKMTRAEIAKRNRELNAQRQKQYNTKG